MAARKETKERKRIQEPTLFVYITLLYVHFMKDNSLQSLSVFCYVLSLLSACFLLNLRNSD